MENILPSYNNNKELRESFLFFEKELFNKRKYLDQYFQNHIGNSVQSYFDTMKRKRESSNKNFNIFTQKYLSGVTDSTIKNMIKSVFSKILDFEKTKGKAIQNGKLNKEEFIKILSSRVSRREYEGIKQYLKIRFGTHIKEDINQDTWQKYKNSGLEDKFQEVFDKDILKIFINTYNIIKPDLLQTGASEVEVVDEVIKELENKINKSFLIEFTEYDKECFKRYLMGIKNKQKEEDINLANDHI